ncbi:MAG: hypothetical protein OXE98_00685, partial [Hyphomicrobiales bacterium]|nr:hypothetical protein [Hyphomicrobiales bacterium]
MKPIIYALLRNWHRILSPVVVLALAIFSTAALLLSGSAPPREIPEEHSWAISVETAQYVEVRPQLRLYGRLVAGRTAEL